MSMGAKILRGAGWLLACLGVAAAFLGVQVVVLLFTQSLAYLLADLTANALGSKPAAALDLYLSLFVQIASLILFWWWWHRLEPRSFLRTRRSPLDGALTARLKRVAGLVLLVTKRRTFEFYTTPEQLPKGLGGQTAFGNPGMVIYIAMCAALTALSMYGLF